MQAFEAVHGDKGLLFVLDEMLDYLASRKDNELRVDLAVLREIGEICKSTRFRFIGGVQEAIFDNPRFASAADAVRRVKERFTQMRISRDDIAYVVQERLLRKTPEQKAKIREHLQVFTPAYEGMAENLERFDERLPELLKALAEDDLLVITADHGNDPTYPGTDHTRERVPLLAIGGGEPRNLGVRDGSADLGATVAAWLGIEKNGLPGEDFLS